MNENNKQLAIIEKIETRLKQPRDNVVFPLTPTHRKELRKLRDENIGSLRTQVKFVRQEKLDEWKENIRRQMEERAEKEKKKCDILNKDWQERIKQIMKIIKERKNKEKEIMPLYATTNSSYEVNHLLNKETNIEEYLRRTVGYDTNRAIKEKSEQEFNEKYGEAFDTITDKIEKLNTAYEEAINFGDLEIVKELYYKMKDADSMLEKIRNIRV